MGIELREEGFDASELERRFKLQADQAKRLCIWRGRTNQGVTGKELNRSIRLLAVSFFFVTSI